MISHAIAIRTLQRQELFVEAERQQLIEQYCAPSALGVGRLFRSIKQFLGWTLAGGRSPHTVLRVATQG